MFPVAREPGLLYKHSLAATVAPRPPDGRVLGVTVVCPSPSSTSLAICRSQCGEKGEAPPLFRSELQRGSSWVRRFRGGNDGPGSRLRPRESGGWLAFPEFPRTGRHSLPGFGLVREDRPCSKGLWGRLGHLPAGAVIRKVWRKFISGWCVWCFRCRQS